jgi:DNA polymerase V
MAAAKLRKGKMVAGALSVFIRTNPFQQDQPQFSNAQTIGMMPASNSTQEIHKAAQQILKKNIPLRISLQKSRYYVAGSVPGRR